MALSEKWIKQRKLELLAKSSKAEKSAYKILLTFGVDVVRQKPIVTGRRIYFADLFLPKYNLILEIDGGYHYTAEQKRLDTNRSNSLWRMGYHVCRLSNRDAHNPEKLIAKIKLATKK